MNSLKALSVVVKVCDYAFGVKQTFDNKDNIDIDECFDIVKKDLEILNILKSQIKITSMYKTKNEEYFVTLENIRTQTETHIKLAKEEYERLKELKGE